MEKSEDKSSIGCPMAILGRGQRGHAPFVFYYNEGTWNFSPTKATPAGGDFISQKEWVYLEGDM